MSSVEIKSVDEGAVRRAVDEYASHLLSSRPEVETIVVFGSFETGDFAPGSDLDVFVVLSESDKPPWERVVDFLPGPFPVPMDVFAYTRQELTRLEDSPILRAVARSRWRYGRVRRADATSRR